MLEKIIAALKAGVKNTTSVSDRTFQDFAKIISAGVTEEGQIAEAIKAYVPVIESIQGNINSVVATAVQEAKKVDPANPKPAEQKAVDPQTPDIAALIEAAVGKVINPLKEKLDGIEKKEKVSTLVGSVKSEMMQKYNLKESLCDKVLSHIQIDDTTTQEALAQNALKEYNSLAVEFGLGEAKPAIPGASGGSSDGDASVFAALKAKKQAEGVLPKQEQKS